MATATSAQQTGELTPQARHAIRGAWMGFFVDMFDIYLPIVVLAPALIYFVSPEMSASTIAIVGGSIFAATLLGRPVGAIIFGHLADTIGRRRSTIISVVGFGVGTLLIAFLPGYQQWGIAAVIIFVLLRFVDGVFLGGEYTSASPLAMEYSPKEKRGFYGALIQSGYPLAFATISLLTLVLLQVIPAGDLNSPYVQWGWRIPFVIGALMAFALAYYYVTSVTESELFEAAAESESDGEGGSPLLELFRGPNLWSFLQVFVMMAGFWLTLYTASAMLPGLLTSELGLSGTSFTITLTIAFLVLAASYLGAGVISQKVGRRPFIIVNSVVMATLGTLLFYLLISTAPTNLLAIILYVTAIVVVVTAPWGLVTTYINERFQTGVRASGFGLGYSLAVIPPAFYAFYQAGLAGFMPFKYTPLPLLVIGALLMLVGAAWGPETKDVDFSEDAAATGPLGQATDAGVREGSQAAPRSGASRDTTS
ncbi:MAG: MFS transporter [Actinomycetota bacterium]|nr:MFS transporter [Actinomycetota bacterium]